MAAFAVITEGLQSKASNTPEIVSSITLLNTRKQINIENQVIKTSTLKKEGVYFAFPFMLTKPRMQYQSATAWVNPETDMLPGANRQWFVTQGGVLAESRENNIAWATVDAPLITLGDINRGLWPESLHIKDGTLFSYVMNNYWYTDTPAQQGGTFAFRYALTSGPAVEQSTAMTLAGEQRSPLLAMRRYNMGWHVSLSDKGIGFLNAEPAGINILTIRPVSGERYLLRVHNTTSHDVTAHVAFRTVNLREVYLSSALGDRISDLEHTEHDFSLSLRHSEIKSVVVCVGRNDTLSP